MLGAIGLGAGVHRLWSHRSYDATLPMRIILMLFFTITVEDSIYQWSRDHRLHHKYTDTEADPYNASNGLFFSHMGWLMVRKNKDVISKGKTIDIDDLKNDGVVMFQKKYYFYLLIILRFVLPIFICTEIFDENLSCAIFLNFTHIVYLLHGTWTVNSLAHEYGSTPYNINIKPKDNTLVTYITYGDGHHNYHHTYPFDYTGNLYGPFIIFNPNTLFIDICNLFGMVNSTKRIDEETRLKLLNRNSSEYFSKFQQIFKSQMCGILYNSWPIILFLSPRYLIFIFQKLNFDNL